MQVRREQVRQEHPRKEKSPSDEGLLIVNSLPAYRQATAGQGLVSQALANQGFQLFQQRLNDRTYHCPYGFVAPQFFQDRRQRAHSLLCS